MMLFFVLFLRLIFIPVNGLYLSNPIECSGQNINYLMDVGDMSLVQSPNFPKTMNSSTNVLDCSFTFARKDNQRDGIYFIFTNGFTINYVLPNSKIHYFDGFSNFDTANFIVYESYSQFTYTKNENAISYRYSKDSGTFFYSAFQAFVYVPEINELNSNCIMNGKNFHLNNSWQVVPIFGISENSLQTENCFWNFTVSKNLSLKIVVNILEVNETATITDDSGTTHPLSKGVIYLNGSAFAIQYTKIPKNNESLAAFVSAVDLTIPPANALLQITQEYSDYYKSNLTHFSNYDPINGYASNTIYSAQINYKPKTVMTFSNPTPFTEYLADPVYLSINGNKHLMGKTVQIKEGYNVSVQFISDQNIFGAGFDLIQNEHECNCPPEKLTIPCNACNLGVSFTDQSDTYCSNMNCSFSFVSDQNCQDGKLKVSITLRFRDNAGDSFTLIANDKLVKNYSSAISYEKLVFDQKTKLQGIFISGTSPNMFYAQPKFQLWVESNDGNFADKNVTFLIFMFIFTVFLSW